jgi:tellurite resistance protein TerA
LLSKVKLESKGDSHTIKLKSKSSSDGIIINLNWKTSADLDLGCFYELKPAGGFLSSLAGGSKMVIDGLQFSNGRGGSKNQNTKQGCFTKSPWVWHQGDDLSGSQSNDGEFIHINPQGYNDLKRVHIYAFIYEGVASWSQTNSLVTINVPGQQPIEIEMGRQSSSKTFCVLATLDFLGNDQIKVSKQVTFHGGHAEADRTYGWGMKWSAGRK